MARKLRLEYPDACFHGYVGRLEFAASSLPSSLAAAFTPSRMLPEMAAGNLGGRIEYALAITAGV